MAYVNSRVLFPAVVGTKGDGTAYTHTNGGVPADILAGGNHGHLTSGVQAAQRNLIQFMNGAGIVDYGSLLFSANSINSGTGNRVGYVHSLDTRAGDSISAATNASTSGFSDSTNPALVPAITCGTTQNNSLVNCTNTTGIVLGMVASSPGNIIVGGATVIAIDPNVSFTLDGLNTNVLLTEPAALITFADMTWKLQFKVNTGLSIAATKSLSAAGPARIASTTHTYSNADKVFMWHTGDPELDAREFAVSEVLATAADIVQDRCKTASSTTILTDVLGSIVPFMGVTGSGLDSALQAYVVTANQESDIVRTDCNVFGPVTSVACNTLGTTTVNCADTTGLVAGMTVSGHADIPADATIESISTNVSFDISATATGTNSVSLNFSGDVVVLTSGTTADLLELTMGVSGTADAISARACNTQTTNVVLCANTSGIVPTMVVSGHADIPGATTVVSVIKDTSFVISAPATGTNAVNLDFAGGIVVVPAGFIEEKLTVGGVTTTHFRTEGANTSVTGADLTFVSATIVLDESATTSVANHSLTFTSGSYKLAAATTSVSIAPVLSKTTCSTAGTTVVTLPNTTDVKLRMAVTSPDFDLSCTTTFPLTPTIVTTASTASIAQSMTVAGTGIPVSTTILSIDSPTTFTLSAPVTVAGTNDLTFGGHLPAGAYVKAKTATTVTLSAAAVTTLANQVSIDFSTRGYTGSPDTAADGIDLIKGDVLQETLTLGTEVSDVAYQDDFLLDATGSIKDVMQLYVENSVGAAAFLVGDSITYKVRSNPNIATLGKWKDIDVGEGKYQVAAVASINGEDVASASSTNTATHGRNIRGLISDPVGSDNDADKIYLFSSSGQVTTDDKAVLMMHAATDHVPGGAHTNKTPPNMLCLRNDVSLLFHYCVNQFRVMGAVETSPTGQHHPFYYGFFETYSTRDEYPYPVTLWGDTGNQGTNYASSNGALTEPASWETYAYTEVSATWQSALVTGGRATNSGAAWVYDTTGNPKTAYYTTSSASSTLFAWPCIWKPIDGNADSIVTPTSAHTIHLEIPANNVTGDVTLWPVFSINNAYQVDSGNTLASNEYDQRDMYGELSGVYACNNVSTSNNDIVVSNGVDHLVFGLGPNYQYSGEVADKRMNVAMKLA